MAATDAGDNKKSFGFRMSKKVAELTQVVHMLFTRNHEKEVELEAVKEAYEYEIDLVINDAKARVERLEVELKRLEHNRGGETEQVRAELGKEMVKREQGWEKRFGFMEKQLVEEKRECQHARDLLVTTQKDIEGLREGQNEEINRKSRELDAKTRDVNLLKQTINNLQKQVKEGETSSQSVLQELRRDNEKIQRELNLAYENLEENDKAREDLSAKIKQLENDLRFSKKELMKRTERSSRSSAGSRSVYRETVPSMEYAEEIERLRREIQRYRNELCNREDNFNRMFTEQHPVVVNRRASRTAGPDPSNARCSMVREPTFSLTASYPSPPSRASAGLVGNEPAMNLYHSGSRTESREDDLGAMSVTLSPRQGQTTITARLPQLGFENRRQVIRLAKPRPLPREMLSAKAGGHG